MFIYFLNGFEFDISAPSLLMFFISQAVVNHLVNKKVSNQNYVVKGASAVGSQISNFV